MIDTLSTVGACPARLTATVVGSGSIETRPSILTGVVQTFVVFLKKKKEEKKFNTCVSYLRFIITIRELESLNISWLH